MTSPGSYWTRDPRSRISPRKSSVSPLRIETLRRCVAAAKATLLHIHLHHFQPSGVSGVAVLAESHISVHTWPEKGFAAFDVFMCGDAEPRKALDVFKGTIVEVRA